MMNQPSQNPDIIRFEAQKPEENRGQTDRITDAMKEKFGSGAREFGASHVIEGDQAKINVTVIPNYSVPGERPPYFLGQREVPLGKDVSLSVLIDSFRADMDQLMEEEL